MIHTWTTSEAIELCRKIEDVAPMHGCHVGLTGGLLYKDGPRKDCDIILYRIRQIETIDYDGLFQTLQAIGITKLSGFGFCIKAEYEGRRIDFLLPEEEGNYNPDEDNFFGEPPEENNEPDAWDAMWDQN
ncbi:hypothetical protein UFOVP861_20 [uncultured Caudovirales phage]|jgi:hypothetical protein|uniref:Uncharacterized protein n=1 Tax=uncultured Caudovirales phage TaxID=2100421 RepID=A0A6J5P6H5_9CAUD|nr:hypothetical protein UFOVP861_20 [uncultured Caudovirales phage]